MDFSKLEADQMDQQGALDLGTNLKPSEAGFIWGGGVTERYEVFAGSRRLEAETE